MGHLFSAQKDTGVTLQIIKVALISKKLKQASKRQFLFFGMSAITALALAHCCFALAQKVYALAIYRKTGFGVCTICMKETTDIVIKKCGHFNHCHQCELKKQKTEQMRCNTCGKECNGVIKVYI